MITVNIVCLFLYENCKIMIMILKIAFLCHKSNRGMLERKLFINFLCFILVIQFLS